MDYKIVNEGATKPNREFKRCPKRNELFEWLREQYE